MIKSIVECDKCNKTETYKNVWDISPGWCSVGLDPLNIEQAKTQRKFSILCIDCSGMVRDLMER